MSHTISELRRGRVYRWRWRIWAAKRVILLGKEGIPAVILGVLSIIVAVLLAFLTFPQSLHFLHQPWLLTLMAAGSLGLTAVAAMTAARWALRVMPPMDYAQVLIAGRSPSAVLQIVSSHIEEACTWFRNEIEPFKKQRVADTVKVRKLALKMTRRNGDLQRLSTLLKLTAVQLEIPLPRLRDRLFQYDPAMQAAQSQRCIRNLEALGISDRSELPLPGRMKDELWIEIDRILDTANKIIGHQQDLQKYTSLDQDVLYLAGLHSTSEAIQQYSRALSSVANHILKSLEECSGDSSEDSEAHCEVLQDGIRAIRFLARKQHTHSGFDLDKLCESAFQARLKELRPSESTQYRTLLTLLRICSNLLRHEDRADEKPDNSRARRSSRRREIRKARSYRPLSLETDREGYREAFSALGPLKQSWKIINEVVWGSREKIAQEFKRYYQEWDNASDPSCRVVHVTHGFSSTVRDVLTEAFKEGSLGQRDDRIRIFIIRSEEQDDLDSRLMAHALAALRSVLAELPSAATIDLAVADVKSLAGFLDGETKVLVVLGAEAFDNNRRVIHPQGIDLEILDSELDHAKSHKIVILAESYKQQEILSDSQFYRYHLDRIRVYPPDMVDAVITDTRTFRKPESSEDGEQSRTTPSTALG